MPPACGDNLRNQPFEICDGTDLASQTCKAQGFAAGALGCATDCRSFNTGGCNTTPTCGDGEVNQPSELCDLSDLRGQSCPSLGLGSGTLRCAADCHLDASQCTASNQVISNKGREFITGFLANPFGSSINVSAVTTEIQLTSDVSTSVTVQYPVNTPSFSQTVSLTPGQVTTVDLPNTAESNWPAGQVRNNAVRLSGSKDFAVYIMNRGRFTTDAGMGLPVEALGTSYILTTYQGSSYNGDDRPEFLVVAAFDGTTVTITPTASLRIPSPGTTAQPNVPFQVQLNRGQGFRGEASFFGTDFTGTVIESNRPVAVLNGNTCATVSVFTSACDHVFEAAHPVTSWGIAAVVANLPGRPGGSIYRVVASADGTQVSLDGNLQTILNRGKFLEVGPLAGNHFFTADHPIFVSQFMTGIGSPGAISGDPAMVNIISPDQYLKSYTFWAVPGAQFASHFLSVITPTAAIGALKLDGKPIAANQFSPVAGSIFSAAVVPISSGAHTTTSPQPHGITIGAVNFADSYLYPGGAQLAFNLFCGDGRANRDTESCDGNDFRGSNCESFGFASGLLQCTVDCRTDTSQCAGSTRVDRDGDGFPAEEDCNDQDPLVNPGVPEVPGNGIDDDCNSLTPDSIPQGGVSCRLFTDRLSYDATQIVSFQAEAANTHPSQTMVGLSAALQVTGGATLPVGTRQLAPLPPGARAQQNFVLSAAGNPPGSYVANLTVTAGAQSVTLCSASFTIMNSTATGAGLTGTLTLSPDKVNAGDPSSASYTVRNGGNAALPGLAVRVLLLDPLTGAIVGELDDTADLNVGGSFSNSQPFSTVGLAINKVYLAVLLARPSGSAVEQTLASASLTVVNSPPVCAKAVASVVTLWPPNHKLNAVTVTGVTDPENDPITVTVLGVLQDEPTSALGSGDTCPDATGIGSPQASLRAERAGPQDGRVYHIYFKASDGRGGQCEGQVQVCVPHDNGHGETCVDQGALYDSTVCR
ncbi:MAG TPA: MopE-related protein [Thermoanaerobaculia bacterium]|nr:MopE-related protein [Thermoanaerobaculia bacterium]